MAQTNLITSARAVIGLLKTIDDKDNLPEWAQEKIAKAEMMLVGVWDYLQSQKAMGNDPQQGVEEGSLKEGKGLEGELARFLKSNGFKGPYRLGKLPKWAAELSEFDKTVLIMVQGDDVEYDEFVVDIGYGILYWGAEGGMTKMTEKAIVNHIKLGQQGVAEGSLNEGQYEMMMRNGQVKKFIAKDDADAKRIAAGHGAKSVIKLRGGVPAGKVAEQGVAEGEKTMSRAAKGNEKYGKDGMKALAKAGRDGASEKKLDAIRDRHDNYNEEWSQKYKSSINCSHPKGFSQKAHCAGKNKHNESIAMEMVCEDCGMCETHGDLNEIKKGAKDSNGYTKCWSGYHAAGTKKSATTGKQVRNCVPNEDIEESDEYFNMLERSVSQAQHNLMVGVANNPQFAQQVKVKQQVGQEFAKADTGRDISKLPMRVTKKK
jgi:hypothetical protein